MPNIWLCSDHHLYHRNIIKYCNRPFKDEYEMNQTLLDNHNKLVQKKDTVIFLGDVSAGLKGRDLELQKLLQKFNGNKILLLGNHDHGTFRFYEKCGFQSVGTYLEIDKYFLCHYGLEHKNIMSRNELSLIKVFGNSKCTEIVHGHKHNDQVKLTAKNGFNTRHNMCMECTDYKPVLLQTLK